MSIELAEYIVELILGHSCSGDCICHDLKRHPEVQAAFREISSQHTSSDLDN